MDLGKINWKIVLILLGMWAVFMVFFYLKADEITKDPCRVCSERMGENVVCQTQTVIPKTRVYYSNGSIVEDNPEIKIVSKYNVSFENFSI